MACSIAHLGSSACARGLRGMGCPPRRGLRAVRYQLHIYPGKGSLDSLLIQSCACANDGVQKLRTLRVSVHAE